MTRPFRFGVVAAPQGGGQQWRDLAQKVESLGYATLLSPDNLHLPTPTASLAAAAGVTSTLRVGSYVLASPLRTPRAAAWEAHSLATVTDGRFELGIGTGLPSMREQAAELGLPYGSGRERLAQVGETIDHLRKLEAGAHVPVLVAAAGPKALALAGEKADIAAVAAGPLAPRSEVADMFAAVRAAAGPRGDAIEYTTNVFVVGDEVPPWVRDFVGADAQTLIEHDSLTLLRGSVSQMAEELQRRRKELGVSYVTVNAAYVDEFAPVVDRLTGR